jgi:transposase
MTKIKTEKVSLRQEEYSTTFKRWISREIESGKIGIKEAIDSFNINRDAATIYRWIHEYGLGKELSLATMTPQEKQDKLLLEKRIKELEKALDMAKLKNIAIETMIDVAEEQFNISIRKKAGLKQ